MTTRGNSSKNRVAVTWELVGDLDDEVPTAPDGVPAIGGPATRSPAPGGRVLVDVEAPLRPFGSMPTPPKGTPRAPMQPPQRGHSLPRLRSDEGDAV
jgi:hypothetical protein